MSIFDAIKNSVLQGFDTSITAMDILLALGVSLLAGLFVLLIYKNSRKGISVTGEFCVTLLLITSISAMIVLTITSNLALSLGMVGALSIVRFRTAIKDSIDTAFLFWAVAAGITAGAGFYMITLIGCLFIGAMCLLCMLTLEKTAKAYLLVVRTEDVSATDKVEAILKNIRMPYKLSALTQSPEYTEAIYELSYKDKYKKAIANISALDGVNHISLVDCRKS